MYIVLRAQYASDIIIVLEVLGSRKGNDWPTAPQLVTEVAKFRSRHVALQPF